MRSPSREGFRIAGSGTADLLPYWSISVFLVLRAVKIYCPRPTMMKDSWFVLLVLALLGSLAHAASYQYTRIGNKEDVQTQPTAGIAMMGGGSDLDEAFRWLCNKGDGGDFLVLRATGDDDYNPYVNGLCKLNSVATLIIPSHEAALDPAVAEIIRKAEAVF